MVIFGTRQYSLGDCIIGEGTDETIRVRDLLEAGKNRAESFVEVEVWQMELNSREQQAGELDLTQGQSLIVLAGVAIVQEYPNSGGERIEEEDENGFYHAITVRDRFGLTNGEISILRKSKGAAFDPAVPTISAPATFLSNLCSEGSSEAQPPQKRARMTGPIAAETHEESTTPALNMDLEESNAADTDENDEEMDDMQSTEPLSKAPPFEGHFNSQELLNCILDARDLLETQGPSSKQRRALGALVTAAGSIINARLCAGGEDFLSLIASAESKEERNRLARAARAVEEGKDRIAKEQDQRTWSAIQELVVGMKEIKVHVGWGTAEDRKDVVRSIRQRQVEDKMKLDEEREKHQKKLDNKIKATEKKQEEAKRLVEEKAAEAIILTSEVAGLSQRMSTQPDLSTAQQLTEKTKALAGAEEAKAWHPVGGVM